MYEIIAYRPYKDIPLVTALPASPSNGDMVVLVDSVTDPTYTWLLRYVAAKPSNKWVFCGGSPLEPAAAGSIVTSSSTYVDLTSGPTATVPVSGVYLVKHQNSVVMGTSTNSGLATVVTGSTSGDGAASLFTIAQTNASAKPTMEEERSLVASETLKLRVKSTTSQSATFGPGTFSLVPVAIGG